MNEHPTPRPQLAAAQRRRGYCLLPAALFLAWVCGPVVAAAERPQVSWMHDKGKSVAAQVGDTMLWQFNYAVEQPKPFFHPVALPGGKPLTWNSPPDHRWHHGLWFSWKYINGVNYWEPNNQTKKPDGRTQWKDIQITTRDDGTAEIRMHLDYRAPDNKIVLSESRTVAVSAPLENGRFHFDWTCTFTAGDQDAVLDRTPLPHEPGGEVYGGYAGLSVRFAKQWANRQAMTNEGPVEFSPQSRYRGKAVAMDYSGDMEGQPVGIAICDHPGNLNHPSPWYAIRSNVMSYFSPAVICNQKHTLKARQRFTLRYRVIVHPDRMTADGLKREFDQFVSDSPGNKRP